jgi:hypothetical protein
VDEKIGGHGDCVLLNILGRPRASGGHIPQRWLWVPAGVYTRAARSADAGAGTTDYKA